MIISSKNDAQNAGVYAIGSDAKLPDGFLVGHAQDLEAGTGCTAILCPQGAIASVKVQGGAPATRETDLLDPENMVQTIHAVVLSGGSAFGLDACSGVMKYLESVDIGLAFQGSVVPIVVGAALFDLGLGNGFVRPDAAMGFAAAKAADTSNVNNSLATGNIGAGTGASVGKFLGPQTAMKSGLGLASVSVGELLVSAIVAVNAAGNIYDRQSGNWLAGVLDPESLPDSPKIMNPYQAFTLMLQAGETDNGDTVDTGNTGNTDNNGNKTNSVISNSNTTIGCILTNARLTKAQAAKVALMTHDGYARSIEPVHTSFDGDAVFCLAHGPITSQQDFVGALAAQVMELAIHNAAASASSAYGLLANLELQD